MQQEQINQIIQAERLNQRVEEIANDISEMKEYTESIKRNFNEFKYDSDITYKMAAWFSIISSISVVSFLGYLAYVAYKLKVFEQLDFLMNLAK